MRNTKSPQLSISREGSQQVSDNLSTSQVLEEVVEPISIALVTNQSGDAAPQDTLATAETESLGLVSNDVEMEDSYAPDPHELAPASEESLGDVHVAETAPIANDKEVTSEAPDGESDPYEPPEASPAVSDDEPMSMDSPPFSPASPKVIEHLGTDMQPGLPSPPQRAQKVPTITWDRPSDTRSSNLPVIGVRTYYFSNCLLLFI